MQQSESLAVRSDSVCAVAARVSRSSLRIPPSFDERSLRIPGDRPRMRRRCRPRCVSIARRDCRSWPSSTSSSRRPGRPWQHPLHSSAPERAQEPLARPGEGAHDRLRRGSPVNAGRPLRRRTAQGARRIPVPQAAKPTRQARGADCRFRGISMVLAPGATCLPYRTPLSGLLLESRGDSRVGSVGLEMCFGGQPAPARRAHA